MRKPPAFKLSILQEATASGLGDFLHQALKFLRLKDCEIRENLAIEFDVGLAETVHELAVGGTQIAAGDVDTHDPQSAILLFLLFAAAISVSHRLIDGIISGTDILAGIPVKTFCPRQDALATLAGLDCACNSGHILPPVPIRARRAMRL